MLPLTRLILLESDVAVGGHNLFVVGYRQSVVHENLLVWVFILPSTCSSLMHHVHQ
jgi:hypothetical protein